MSYCMLRTAHIQIYRHPVLQQFLIRKFIIIIRVNISKIIPAGSCRSGHCGSLSQSRYPVMIIFFPFCIIIKRSLTILTLVIFKYRKFQRKFCIIQNMDLSIFCVYDRHRLTPVSLSGKYPLAKSVINSFSGNSHRN